MDPISLIGSGLSILIGAIGNALAAGDHAKARELRQQAIDEYGEDMLPVLDRLVAQEVGPTALASIRGDDKLRGQQVNVMDELQNVYDSEGMTQADRAALDVAADEVAQRSASDYASQQQQLARMGQQAGGAMTAALASQSGQDAANATARMGREAQASARQRALQALMASGDLAGRTRGQDWGEQSQAAQAQDAMTLFNADQRTNAQRGNNESALAMYDAKMGLAAAKNRAREGLAQDFEGSAARTEDTAAGIGAGVQEGLSAAGRYRQKKGV